MSQNTAGKHVNGNVQEFKLKEKVMSMSGDSFKITNCRNGATAFKVKGHAMSVLSEKKTLSDANGVALYKLSEAMLTMRDRMFIVDAQTKQPVLTIRKKGIIPVLGTSTILCFRPGSDKEPYLAIKGNILRKSFSVTEVSSGRQAASVKRKTNFRSVMMEKDSYVLRVEAGIDAALMCTLVVALDEHYRDDGNKSGMSAMLNG